VRKCLCMPARLSAIVCVACKRRVISSDLGWMLSGPVTF
jgi:hypothetical protein